MDRQAVHVAAADEFATDRIVDAILNRHWQESVGEQAASVPEPCAPIALVGMGTVALTVGRWQRRRPP